MKRKRRFALLLILTALMTAAVSSGEIRVQAAGQSGVTYRTHVQSYGWQEWKKNGEMSGTSGEAKRLEGIEIRLDGQEYEGGIRYRTHVQSYGWQDWKKDGEMSGTSGQAKRLEAIQIELTGKMASYYDVYYRVHAQTFGWMGWAKNGEQAGTAGYAKRLEGIEIKLVKKGGAVPRSTALAYRHPMVKYKTHVQGYGWQSWVEDGAMSGTSGEAKRLEGIEIMLANQEYVGSIQYKTHVQSYGWQGWSEDGAMSGTSGQAKRLEAIQIRLSGEMAKQYDIYYRVHAQSYGWMGWAKNGQSAGTAGYGKRLEGIEIQVVDKGASAPGKTTGYFAEAEKNHQYQEWVTVKAATCTEEGKQERTCSSCGNKESKTIAALGHSMGEWKTTKEASCTESGMKERSCTLCGEAKETQAVEAPGDKAGEWEITKEATCTESGTKEQTCTRCGEVLATETIEAAGHTGTWKTVTSSTCSTHGQEKMTCTKCGEEQTRELPLDTTETGHKELRVMTEAPDYIAPTCEGWGRGSVQCEECGTIISNRAFKSLGHVYGGEEKTEEATCEKDGVVYQECTRDGCTSRKVIKVLSKAEGHKWSDHREVLEEATCTKEGKEGYRCSVCGATKNVKTIAKKAHSFDYKIIQEGTCVQDEIKEGTCSVCGETKQVTTKHASGQHSNIVYHKGLDAMCGMEGQTGLIECTTCGKVISEPKKIPALTHDFSGPVSKIEGKTECTPNRTAVKCVHCGAEMVTQEFAAGTGHQWSGEGDVVKEGLYKGLRYCTVKGCDAVLPKWESGPAGYDEEQGVFTYVVDGKTLYCGTDEYSQKVPIRVVWGVYFIADPDACAGFDNHWGSKTYCNIETQIATDIPITMKAPEARGDYQFEKWVCVTPTGEETEVVPDDYVQVEGDTIKVRVEYMDKTYKPVYTKAAAAALPAAIDADSAAPVISQPAAQEAPASEEPAVTAEAQPAEQETVEAQSEIPAETDVQSTGGEELTEVSEDPTPTADIKLEKRSDLMCGIPAALILLAGGLYIAKSRRKGEDV